LYKDSPNYNLDQSNTLTAMAALQDFINAHPESPFRQECTQYIAVLRDKLELKAYDKAKQYYKTSAANIANYRSSVVSITNFLREYPDSKYNEELAYLRVDAQYHLAKNSFCRQVERAASGSRDLLPGIGGQIPEKFGPQKGRADVRGQPQRAGNHCGPGKRTIKSATKAG
jgi:outer membrane protein assembly factor BamD (BamD/ComL family)